MLCIVPCIMSRLCSAHDPRSPAQLGSIQAGEALTLTVSDLSQTATETVRSPSSAPPQLCCKSKCLSSSSARVPVFFFFPSWGFAKAHLNSSIPVLVQWPVNALCYRDMLPFSLHVESFLQKYP